MKWHCRKFTLALASVIAVAGCKKKESNIDHGDTPPPVESIQPSRCADGGGIVQDQTSAAFFTRSVGDYCIDPNSETRAFGKNAPGTLDQVCTELFDGECEVYRMYGLERVVTVRYADGKGSTSTVNVVLSRFESPRGAFGFYTKRVVADADPIDTKIKPLAVGGAGSLASTISYVWRGLYVAELSYVNDSESPDALRLSASRVLPDLANRLAIRCRATPHCRIRRGYFRSKTGCPWELSTNPGMFWALKEWAPVRWDSTQPTTADIELRCLSELTMRPRKMS